jgi:hypothetical protein
MEGGGQWDYCSVLRVCLLFFNLCSSSSNYPKETVLHLQHGENSNLKSSISVLRR